MILAFMYETYGSPGIKNAFAGAYDSEEEAFDTLVGNYEKGDNLELLDTDTYGIKCYEWKPLYERDYIDSVDYSLPRHIGEKQAKVRLKHKYDGSVVETDVWALNRNNGEHYHLAQAGRWDRVRERD